MDRGKKPSKLLAAKNSKLYMDLRDIIREHALTFLPVKSLFRCQGVCREWKLQISSPFFAHKQSLAYRKISGLFCQTHGNPPSFVSEDPKSSGVPDPSLEFLPVPVDIRTSANGLLCCQANIGDKAYYICNPATKQWKIIPSPNANHGPDPAIVLVFQPSLLNFVAEYKLVCAFPSADFEGATEFEIFSSKEGSWKVSGEICFAEINLIPKTGVHANGIIYWMSRSRGILTYDMVKDRSQLVKDYSNLNSSLGMLDGKLCKAHASGSSIYVSALGNVHSNTMQMGSAAMMWKRGYSFSVNPAALGVANNYEPSSLIFIGDDVVVGRIGSVMYCYDMTKKQVRALSRSSEYDARVVPYVSTLVYL